MKKPTIILGTVALAGVVFLASLIVLVKLRGGLSAGSGLAEVPVVGDLLGAQAESPVAEAVPTTMEEVLQSGRGLPFLRFGGEGRLALLAEELKSKRTEYDAKLHQVERRQRELDAWQRQMEKERDDLRARFGREKEEIASLNEELNRRDAELAAVRIAMQAAEQSNLKKMAEVCGKMSPDKAAEMLTQMYAGDEQETVIKIVYLMEGRSAAKVLEAIPDAKITAQIAEKLKRINTSTGEGT